MRSAGSRWCVVLALTVCGWLAMSATAAAQGTSYPDAVVLVSGYDSSSAFTTPDPSCQGQEGATWSDPPGPAAALRAAGLKVFSAPVQRGTEPVLLPCTPGDTPSPPLSAYINSYGANDANGIAFASFLGFLRDSYGVQRVHLVAHSDGGNWSRSAITQNTAYNGLDISSLTTLGTPYTGSMIADIGIDMKGGQCDFSGIEQDICEAFQKILDTILGQIGPTTIEQLTHTYMEMWNPQQSIGACTVTTIAGTGFSVPLLDFTYYNPSDGLVGEASALAHSALDLPSLHTIPAPNIPGLASGGTYPVVHTSSLEFISKKTLLNTPEISAKVVQTVSSTPAGGPTCEQSATASAAAKLPKTQDIRVPLRTTEVLRRGETADPGPEDVVVVETGTEVACGGPDPQLLPLLADPSLETVHLGDCRGTLQVKANGRRSGGLLLSSLPRNDVVVTSGNGRLRINVRGAKPKRIKATLQAPGGDAQTLRLNSRGVAQLPAGVSGHQRLEVQVGLKKGVSATAVAPLSIAP